MRLPRGSSIVVATAAETSGQPENSRMGLVELWGQRLDQIAHPKGLEQDFEGVAHQGLGRGVQRRGADFLPAARTADWNADRPVTPQSLNQALTAPFCLIIVNSPLPFLGWRGGDLLQLGRRDAFAFALHLPIRLAIGSVERHIGVEPQQQALLVLRD